MKKKLLSIRKRVFHYSILIRPLISERELVIAALLGHRITYGFVNSTVN